MNTFPFEVQYIIFEQMIGASLNSDSSTNLNCSFESLLNYSLVCKHWNQIFSSILNHISQDPIGWCIKYEKLSLFEKWVKATEDWTKEEYIIEQVNKTPPHNDERCLVDPVSTNLVDKHSLFNCIWSFVNKYIVNYKIKPLMPCITRADNFSFAVFSALGEYQVSEEFLKNVWSIMYQSANFRTNLEDYYRSLVYNGDTGTIEWLAWSPISSENIRKMLLEDNAAANVRYLLERYMISQERKRSILWEPLILSNNYTKIADLESQGINIPWNYIRCKLR